MVAAPSAKSLGMLTAGRKKSVVGLEIEAGSVAATEVRSNGHAEVVGHGVAALAPGVFREGEAADVDALGEALKSLFAEHKLSKGVRLGIGNQRIVVRTLDLPRIEKPAELETAIRFQASDQMPMPLDEAVLDWQLVGTSTGPAGEPRISVVVVAARRDMVEALLSAVRKADLRPVGIDLSAFGMIRALRDRDAAGAEPPRGRACCATWATSSTSRSFAGRSACSRGSPRSASRASPSSSPSAAHSRSNTPVSGWSTWAWSGRSSRSRATPSSSPPSARRRPRARRAWLTSCAARSSSTGRRRGRSRWATSSPAAGDDDPRARAALEASLGRPVSVGRPEGLAASTTPRPPAWSSRSGSRWRTER